MQTDKSVTDICIGCENLADPSFGVGIKLPFDDSEVAIAFLAGLAIRSNGQPKCRLGVTERKNSICPIDKFVPRK